MQEKLFYEDELDALRAAVQAIGGNKQVGGKLWPDKSPDASARMVSDCLNANRAERFTLSQVLMLMRLARAVGFHGLAEYCMAETGYSRPLPLDPQDEAAALVQRMEDVLGQAGQLATRLERLRNAGVMDARAGMRAVG